MSTEHLFSGEGCLPAAELRITGYDHLYRLACMEGDLMVIAAEQRITGQVNDLHLIQLSNIAWSFAQEGYTDTQRLSAGVAGLAYAVEQLALEISTYEWSWWIKAYQEDEESARRAGEEDELSREHVSHYSENGTDYRSLPYRSYSMDGIVYLPVIVPDTGHFDVRERGGERAIAIVPLWSEAVAIARYAVSLNGGYSSVTVSSTDEECTHTGLEAWFLD